MYLGGLFAEVLVTSLSGALSPGPLSTMAVREGARGGAAAGLLLALGHSLLELAIVLGLAFGLEGLLQREDVGTGIALAGGLYLLWLGQGTLRTALATRAMSASEGTATAAGAGALLAAGLGVSLSNPFFLAWWGTVGAGLVGQALDSGAAGVTVLYFAHVLTDFGWLTLLSALTAGGRRVLGTAFHRWALGASGVALLCLGGLFLWRGATGL
ncbi:MAG TPA: LysE family transporter [Dehalococcoidia bacterium]|nr:LysE family transporter [Dehalococcoidia bacterium]